MAGEPYIPPMSDTILDTSKTAAYRILGNGCVPVWVEVHARAVLEALIG